MCHRLASGRPLVLASNVKHQLLNIIGEARMPTYDGNMRASTLYGAQLFVLLSTVKRADGRSLVSRNLSTRVLDSCNLSHAIFQRKATGVTRHVLKAFH